MRIAFYAPMKPPDHPNPSGDRRMARLLMAALEAAGHEVTLASRFRAWEGTGDNRRQAELRRQGRAEAEDLIEGFRGRPADQRRKHGTRDAPITAPGIRRCWKCAGSALGSTDRSWEGRAALTELKCAT